ncbi:MAG: PA14 domain-containing protein [Chloroflexota bacterium]
MVKYIHFFIGLLVTLMMTGTALAQEGPINPQHTDPTWQVTYWNNTSLSGPPVAQFADTTLDHNWGTGSPAAGVNVDQFSARWLRYIDVPPGTYQITVTADDGVRLWVDDQLLIDQWRDQAATPYTAQTYLGPGHHLIRLEYYENLGEAVIRISWTQATQPLPTPPPPPPTIYGWRAEYFNNKSLSGSPALVRDDPRIDFNWGGGSPAPGLIDADGFSVRWSRTADLPAGNYRFIMTVDDGARLFVNGHLLIDAWKVQAPRTYSGDIYLPGGPIMAQMEYFEETGGAVAQLTWTSATTPPPPPPPSTDALGYVTAYRLNVRSGPGVYYPRLGLLYRGDQVRLLGRNYAGTWLKVEVAYNFRGWVSGYYIRSNVFIPDLPVIR